MCRSAQFPLNCAPPYTLPLPPLHPIRRFESQIDTLYKVVHMGTFQSSVQALSLIYQITGNKVPWRGRCACHAEGCWFTG